MRANIGKQLHSPTESTTTPLLPDIVHWSAITKTALLIELTITWEGGIQAAHRCKRTTYSELAAECRLDYWIYPVEVSCLLQDTSVTRVKL